MSFHLKVITPKKLVFDKDIVSLSAPTVGGEVTILKRHVPLVTLLGEGVLTIRTKDDDEYMSIGGGYLETDGAQISILVSRAYGQSEIDEAFTKQAVENAQEILAKATSKTERGEALSLLKRSLIDLSLLRKLRRKRA